MPAKSSALNRPVVSVVVEGYNEARDLGSIEDTMAALEGQDFPLDQIEVILVGSAEPANHWKTLCADDSRFHSVNVLVHGGTHYYELKNSEQESACGLG